MVLHFTNLVLGKHARCDLVEDHDATHRLGSASSMICTAGCALYCAESGHVMARGRKYNTHVLGGKI
jgi:hypothetical protein